MQQCTEEGEISSEVYCEEVYRVPTRPSRLGGWTGELPNEVASRVPLTY
jgi:hypothetical protein